MQVAHTLGVDHVGHTHRPDHPAMAAKLGQVNDDLRTTIEALDEEGPRDSSATLTVLMGDHGMTDDGEHGGASHDETHAAFFAWSGSFGENDTLGVGTSAGSSAPNTSGDSTVRVSRASSSFRWGDSFGWGNGGHQWGEMAQVDFVPSLCLLLGLPIPFSNLGGIRPDLFNLPPVLSAFEVSEAACATSEQYFLHCRTTTRWSRHPASQAFLLNAVQVWAYLGTYAAASGLPDLGDLEEKLIRALDRHEAMRAQEEALHSRRGDCAASGGALEADAEVEAEALWLAYRSFLSGALDMGRSVFTQFDQSRMLAGAVLFAAATVIAISISVRAALVGTTTGCGADGERWVASLLAMAVCHSLGRFSNSYVVSEDRVLVFLVVSSIAIAARRVLVLHSCSARPGASTHSPRVILATAMVAVCVCRFGLHVDATVQKNAIDVVSSTVELIRLCAGRSVPVMLTGIICTIALRAAVRSKEHAAGAMYGASQSLELCTHALAWLIMVVHGASEAAASAQKGDTASWFVVDRIIFGSLRWKIILPRLVYALGILQLLAAFVSTVRAKRIPGGYEKTVVSRRVMMNLESVSRVGIAIVPAWVLTLGLRSNWASFGFVVHVGCLVAFGAGLGGLGAHERCGNIAADKNRVTCDIGVSIAVLWRLLSRHHFHASGHGNTFSDLQ